VDPAHRGRSLAPARPAGDAPRGAGRPPSPRGGRARRAGSYDPDGDPRPAIGGRRRNLLLTTAADFAARLVSRTLVTGTLRERVAVMDRDLFPGGVLDTCDTHPMPWRAARIF
jgi:hypothetical protein